MKSILLILGFLCLGLNAQEDKVEPSESEKLNTYFEEYYQEGINMYPQLLSYLGKKDRYDEWNDSSEEMEAKDLAHVKKGLEHISSNFDYDKLDAQTKVSYDLFVLNAQNNIAGHEFRMHGFPVHQMRGTHKNLPTFLINIHKIDSYEDAEAYISRVEKIDDRIKQLILKLNKQKELGIVAPAFTFPAVLKDCENILSGKPLDNSEEEHILWKDFFKKLNEVEGLSDAQKKTLSRRLENALKSDLRPAYENLIGLLKDIGEGQENDHGAWSLVNGEKYYAYRLGLMTTTDMTPAEIFELGEKEIARIHGEMNAIKEKVGFEGDLQAFFDFMRKDAQFYYPNDEEGKANYLADATSIIDGMRLKLDDLFYVKPKAELEVRAVEPFREQSAGKAFYSRGAPDFSRPGVYYANLYDMTQMPKYQMEALAYHEAIPGHHMQISIAQELDGLPKFRTRGRFTAYSEGWGLYTEYLPKEIGFYDDPYSDFGRLAMELWRSCRLVVDVGIHAKKWSRQEGIDFYSDNTPNPYEDCVKMVERHFVMPGQATSYKIGMNKIIEIRENAKSALGDKFDIRSFHDVVLKNGPVPLSVLEQLVNEWVESL